MTNILQSDAFDLAFLNSATAANTNASLTQFSCNSLRRGHIRQLAKHIEHARTNLGQTEVNHRDLGSIEWINCLESWVNIWLLLTVFRPSVMSTAFIVGSQKSENFLVLCCAECHRRLASFNW